MDSLETVSRGVILHLINFVTQSFFYLPAKYSGGDSEWCCGDGGDTGGAAVMVVTQGGAAVVLR